MFLASLLIALSSLATHHLISAASSFSSPGNSFLLANSEA